MLPWAPLLADADWIKLVFFAVFAVVYLINHLLGGNKKAAEQAKRAARKAAMSPAAPNRPASQGTQAQQSEIDEFLQKARRKEQRREPAPPVAKPQRVKKPVKRLVETPAEVEVAERPRESVAEHVEHHLKNPQFDSRAAHMSDDLARADREREEHLKKAFQHQVGRLTGEPTNAATADKATDSAPSVQHAAQNSTAALLTGLMKDPQNMRQVIILTEILERPVDRW